MPANQLCGVGEEAVDFAGAVFGDGGALGAGEDFGVGEGFGGSGVSIAINSDTVTNL